MTFSVFFTTKVLRTLVSGGTQYVAYFQIELPDNEKSESGCTHTLLTYYIAGYPKGNNFGYNSKNCIMT